MSKKANAALAQKAAVSEEKAPEKRQVTSAFYQECRKAHTELSESGRLSELMKERILPLKAIPPRDED